MAHRIHGWHTANDVLFAEKHLPYGIMCSPVVSTHLFQR
jgi:hypothetical protein